MYNVFSFVLAHFPSTTPYTRTEILKLLKTDVIPKKTPSREEDHEATAAYFKSRHYLFNEQKPLRAIEALREYRKPNARFEVLLDQNTRCSGSYWSWQFSTTSLGIEAAQYRNLIRFLYFDVVFRELERLRLVDPYGIKGMDLLASLYYAFDKGTSVSALISHCNVVYLEE